MRTIAENMQWSVDSAISTESTHEARGQSAAHVNNNNNTKGRMKNIDGTQKKKIGQRIEAYAMEHASVSGTPETPRTVRTARRTVDLPRPPEPHVELPGRPRGRRVAVRRMERSKFCRS